MGLKGTLNRRYFRVLCVVILAQSGCKGLLSHTKSIATPTFSLHTVRRANPANSTGRLTAVSLIAYGRSKAAAVAAAPAGAIADGPSILTDDQLPPGVHVDHAYLNLVAVAFYPQAPESASQVGALTDQQTLRLVDLAVEARERANKDNSPNYVARKTIADTAGEAALVQQENGYVANATPFAIDAASDQQVLGDLDLSDGTYTRFDGILGRSGNVPADHPLFGYTLAITGTLTPPLAASTVPFVIRSHNALIFRIDMSSSPLTIIDGNATNDFSLNFDYSSWFSGIDLTPLTRGGAAAVVDETTNRALITKIEANLSASLLAYGTNGGGDSADSAQETQQELTTVDSQAQEQAADDGDTVSQDAGTGTDTGITTGITTDTEPPAQ